MLINVNIQLNNYFKPFILVARGAGRAKDTRGTRNIRGAGCAKDSLRRNNRISGHSEKELEEVEKEDKEEDDEVLLSSI